MNPRHPITATLAVALTTLLALVVAASPAAASSRAQAYIDESLELAVGFHAARNVTACPTPTITVVKAPAGVPAAAGASVRGSCSIELKRDLVRAAGRERWTRYGTDGERLELCVVIFHEDGHANGLEHTADGLMSEDVLTRLASSSSAAPYLCRAWVKSLERRERAQAAERHARRVARQHRHRRAR